MLHATISATIPATISAMLHANFLVLIFLSANVFHQTIRVRWLLNGWMPKGPSFFFNVGPPLEKIFLTTFYGLYFSHHYIYYTLQIMPDLLCGQFYMYCTLDTSFLWDMGIPHEFSYRINIDMVKTNLMLNNL